MFDLDEMERADEALSRMFDNSDDNASDEDAS